MTGYPILTVIYMLRKNILGYQQKKKNLLKAFLSD